MTKADESVDRGAPHAASGEEARPRISVERLDGILQNLDAILWSADPADFVLHHLSPAVERVFGRPAEAFIGDPGLWLRVVHPDDAGRMQAEFALLPERGALEIEYRIVRPDGEERWIHDRARVVRDADGTPVRIDGIAEDVTARRRAEDALAASENRLRLSEEKFGALLEHAAEAIVIIDETGTIVLVNARCETLFGWSREELLGKPLEVLIPESVRDRHRELQDEYVRAPHPRPITSGLRLRGRHRDGSEIPVEIALSYARTEQGLWVMSHIVDIRARLEVERMKNEFLAVVSHELRTPLTSIRGSLGLLAGGVAGSLGDKAASLVRIALANSERLVRLINDILDIEKIEAGKLAFRFVPVDLGRLVAESIEANQGYGGQLGVTFALVGGPPLATVNGDPDRLLQVLANLLSNAAKYSPRGGVVTVSITADEGTVRVAVRDTGPGIPEGFRRHLFERFAQADGSDSRQKGGTGLGLAISKAIVEKHGGHIGFETTPGGGTTFYFELPEVTGAASSLPAVERDRPCLLVCEDDPEVADVLRIMVEQAGFAAEVVGTAADARKALAERRFVGLTLDLTLPDEDGMSLLRELHESDAGRTPPVIVVSGRAEEARRDGIALGCGVLDWVTKPIDPGRLRAALAGLAAVPASGARRRILHVEDDPDVVQVVAAVLEPVGDVVRVATLAEARAALERDAFDLVLLDLDLPDGWGTDLIPWIARPGEGRRRCWCFRPTTPGRTPRRASPPRWSRRGLPTRISWVRSAGSSTRPRDAAAAGAETARLEGDAEPGEDPAGRRRRRHPDGGRDGAREPRGLHRRDLRLGAGGRGPPVGIGNAARAPGRDDARHGRPDHPVGDAGAVRADAPAGRLPDRQGGARGGRSAPRTWAPSG